MELSQQQKLTALLDAGPSYPGWMSLSESLSKLKDAALQEALSMVSESVLRWPAAIRRAHLYGATASWVKPLFDGKIDPRLALVGWASVSHGFDLAGADETFDRRLLYPIAKAFAQYIDPSFAPVDTVLSTKYDYTSASGCGGGFDEEVRGDGTRGLRWYDNLTEHAADTSSSGDWSPYGIASDCKLKIGRYERGNVSLSFSAEGSAPLVLELAYAWGALWRSGSLTLEAAVALEESRKVWRKTP